MKRFFKKTLLFLIASSFIIGSIFIIISFSPNLVYRTNIKTTTGGYGASLLRYREAQSYGEVDLVFIGSSHCYRGFDTRIFEKVGISSFNLGSSAQTPLNSYFLLKNYTPNLKPKKIILETYWGTLQTPGIESTIDLISNIPCNKNSFKMASLTGSVSPIITWFFEYLHRLKYPLINELLIPTEADLYIPGGYLETIENKYYNYGFTNKSKKTLKKFIQLEYIDSINNYCKSNNIELILVCAPVYKSAIDYFTNFEIKMMELDNYALINKLVFINFNKKNIYEKIKWNKTEDWYDNTHLTQKGVEKFNNHLIEKYDALLKE